MAVDWPQLLRQKPREVKLAGDKIAEQIEKENGLNELLFRLETLNFLEITDIGRNKDNQSRLPLLSPQIGQLQNLTTLVLQGNGLCSVPDELGSLTKLKCLNLSRNELETLPVDLFRRMTQLQSLNLEQNRLKSLPNMSPLVALLSFKCGSNQLTEFPSSLCDGIHKNKTLSQQSSIPIYEGGAVHLAELDGSHNQIGSLPGTIERLVALKTLDLSHNCIERLPPELANCHKLRDANFKENPIKDRRLYKLIEQCPTKKVLDYLRNASPTGAAGTEPQTPKTPATGDDRAHPGFHDRPKPKRYMIRVQSRPDDKLLVIASKLAISQRKIVACAIHSVDLSNPKLLRKFLAVQTKLHQTACDNRQKATIATHDLNKVLPPAVSYASKTANDGAAAAEPPPETKQRAVYFDAKVPTKIRLTPLGRSTEMSGMEMYRLLNEEADQYRKERKRNTISGIHKYLHLLKGKQLYPVLLDHQNKVISLPPLTNAEYCKIGPNTSSVLVEVTGESIPTCRMVMNQLLYQFLIIEDEPADEEGGLSKLFPGGEMIVEPAIVQMADSEELLVKYPAKIDFQYDDVLVVVE